MRKRKYYFILMVLIFICSGCMGKYSKIDFTVLKTKMFRNNIENNTVYDTAALKKLNGIKWKYKTNNKVRSTPVIDKNLIYFGSNDGFLYSVFLEDGKLKWKYDCGDPVMSSPAIISDLVIFEAGYTLYALNSNTGKMIWKSNPVNNKKIKKYEYDYFNGDAQDYYHCSPVIYNGIIYIGLIDGLYGIDIKNGKKKWSFKIDVPVRSTPAIFDDKIYFGDWKGVFYSVDLKHSVELWKYEIKPQNKNNFIIYNPIQSSPCVAENTICFGARNGNVYAIERSTGKLKWIYKDPPWWIISSPILYKNKVYIGSDNYGVYVLDAEKGSLLTTYKSDDFVMSSPCISDDVIYFGSGSIDAGAKRGYLYAFDINTGQELWKYKPEYGIHSSPLIKDKIVYFGSDDGFFYALH